MIGSFSSLVLTPTKPSNLSFADLILSSARCNSETANEYWGEASYIIIFDIILNYSVRLKCLDKDNLPWKTIFHARSG